MYSDSVDNRETKGCFFADQKTTPPANRDTYLVHICVAVHDVTMVTFSSIGEPEVHCLFEVP